MPERNTRSVRVQPSVIDNLRHLAVDEHTPYRNSSMKPPWICFRSMAGPCRP